MQLGGSCEVVSADVEALEADDVAVVELRVEEEELRLSAWIGGHGLVHGLERWYVWRRLCDLLLGDECFVGAVAAVLEAIEGGVVA